MKHSSQLTIKSDLSEVKTLAIYLGVICSDNQLDKKLSSLLELVLVEAVNNIILHAYEGNSKFDITAYFDITTSEVIITLKDKGKKFKPKIETEVDTEELAEGNWGLDLINSIADEAVRHRENNYNILTIKKRINDV